MTTGKDDISVVYYVVGALSFIGALVRVLYGWFKEIDNSNKFAQDMATIHLPYITKCLRQIGNRLEIDLDDPPPINYTKAKE